MAPTGFQGLVNKWVKISRTNRDPCDTVWSKPHHNSGDKKYEDNSTRTAETSTIDSSLIFQHQHQPRNEQVVMGSTTTALNNNRLSSFGRRSSIKKSNSYTDLLRRKNEEFRKECPVHELEVNVPPLHKPLDHIDDEYLGVSVEQLFNPLTATHGEDILKTDSVSTCESCCAIHEKVLDYVEFTKFLQLSKEDIIPCKKCNEAISAAIEAAKSLKTITDDDVVVESVLPLNEISCDSTFRRSSAATSTTSPVPIENLNDRPSHHVEESIALMESSRRLFEFMDLHKKRMVQLTQEKNDWQENLDSKLSQFTAMCQSIRQEIASPEEEPETNNHNQTNKSNAINMLVELEAQIGQLKSQQTMKHSSPVRVYQNPHGTVARHTSMLQSDCILHPGSPPENLEGTFMNMHNYVHSHNKHRRHSGCSTSSDVVSSISSSSHSGSIQDDFMFSLDDD